MIPVQVEPSSLPGAEHCEAKRMISPLSAEAVGSLQKTLARLARTEKSNSAKATTYM